MDHVKAANLKDIAHEKLTQRLAAEGLPSDLVQQIREIGWQVNRDICRKVDAEIVQNSILKVGDLFPHIEEKKEGIFKIIADTGLDVHDWCEYTIREGRVTAVFAQEIGQEWMLQTGIRQKIAERLGVDMSSTYHIAFDESIYQGWVDL